MLSSISREALASVLLKEAIDPTRHRERVFVAG